MTMAHCMIVMAGLALPLFVAGSARAADEQPETGQHAKVFDKQIEIKLNYLLYLPPDYNKDPAQKWPLMLFLHGSGERGDDVNKVKVHGPPKVVEMDKDSQVAKDFIVVSPQCPQGKGWKSDELEALLDATAEHYRVDPDRVYLTGLSMGGFGTWDLAANAPKRFAAIVPICGGGNPAMARRLKDLPIWVFHGDADPAVPVQRSDDMVKALKDLNADVKYTRYPGVGHDCWTQTYNNPELYRWLLSHKRGEKKAVETTSEK